jgi:AraC-like DNA-binding protein
MERVTAPSGSIVQLETKWRTRPADVIATDAAVTLWKTPRPPFDVESESESDGTILTYACTPTDVQFWMSGRPVSTGRIVPQTLLLTGPGMRSRAVFLETWRAYRIYLPQALIAECYESATGRAVSTDVVLADAKFVSEPAVEKLIQALVFSEISYGQFGRVYTNSVAMAITARLMATLAGVNSRGSQRGKLAGWRLSRVKEFIEASLGQPLALADLAEVAGLTRTHFASLFRASTGMTPHKYLLRRRVQRAQILLANTALPILQVAFEAGFQTQAHFTVVFKQVTGLPPGSWRAQVQPGFTESVSC